MNTCNICNYKKVLKNLLATNLFQIIEIYNKENDVRDLEGVLSEIGVSSDVLENYYIH